MKLTRHTYGKDRVRVMRIHRDGDRHEVRELTVQAMLTGDFSRIFTHADNSSAVSTDTVKNVINVVARENLALDSEPFCNAVARKFFETYPQVTGVSIHALETRWVRLSVEGKPHAHSFLLDNNGKGAVWLEATRQSEAMTSGVAGFTFMKTTNSGWDKYEKDKYTTILETRDRMCATSLDASWRWSKAPNDYASANAKIMTTMLDVFASTYSESVQDSLFRMASAALEAVPEVIDISLAAPNKHYLLINLDPFKLDNNNQIFLPTDEPHGQIGCRVGRG